MKSQFCIFTIIALCVSSAFADKLATLNVKNWLSYHSISAGKYHTVAVNTDGSIDLYFMKRDERINIRWPVELAIKVERKSKKKGSKWTTRKVKKDGFIQPPQSSENPDKLTLTGVVTGGVQFQLDFKFSKEGATLTAAFVGKPKDAAAADYRLSIISDIDSLVTINKSDRNDTKKIKNKTRGSELRLTSRKGKRGDRIRFYEKIDHAKLKKLEVTAIELRTDKIGRRKLFWSLANSKAGKLLIEPKAENGMPYKGFIVSTVLVDESGKKHSEGIKLEYK